MPLLTSEMKKIASSFMRGLDCPRSLTVEILLRNGEWDQLFSLTTDPSHYGNAADYRRANGATTFLKKWETPLDAKKLRRETIEKWFWAEQQCFKTNRRLDELPLLASQDARYARIYDLLSQMRKNVHSWLGSSPGLYTDLGRFGPGATVSDDSVRSTIPHKMSSIPTFTSGALFHLVPWISTAWARAIAASGDVPQTVPGNKFFTVPKTAISLRACAKEPSVNVYYQLALGQCLRNKLRSSLGIDLNHAQDFHRRVACTSSIDESFATIDLTSASDTIATDLVSWLLPPLWYDALVSVRSPKTLIDKKWVILEKFSSMGNGFTFELETLIFLAILSVVPGVIPGVNTFVYGDDIIVPTDTASDAVAILRYCGFSTNDHKTFLRGPFRESCGGDFYNGADVRGIYQKEDLDEPQKVISLANRIRKFASVDPDTFRDLRATWFACLDLLPNHIRNLRGPTALGDILIHDEELRWKYRWRNGIRWFRTYRPVNRGVVGWNRFAPDVQMAAALYPITLVVRDGRLLVPGRNATGYKIGRAAYS